MIENENLRETYLAHYGIKGQKWGVRNYQNEDGTLTEAGKSRYAKEAAKDAKEYARAKAYYGEGAGNRRKKIKNLISQKMKDPAYKAEFERQLSMQNMEKHQKAANFERHTRDTAAETKRIIKTVASVGITAFSLAALANPQIRVKAGELINKYGQKAFSAIKNGGKKTIDIVKNSANSAKNFGQNIKNKVQGHGRDINEFVKNAKVNTQQDNAGKAMETGRNMAKDIIDKANKMAGRNTSDTIGEVKKAIQKGGISTKYGLNSNALKFARESRRVRNLKIRIEANQSHLEMMKQDRHTSPSKIKEFENMIQKVNEMYNKIFAEEYMKYFKNS